MDIELTTARRGVQCLALLTEAAAREDGLDPDWAAAGDSMVVSVRAHRFTVMNASDDLGWKSFRRLFHGEVVDDDRGARIRGRFRLHAMARVWLTLWFVSMTTIVFLLLAGNLAGGGNLPPAATGVAAVLIPALMLVTAAVLVRVGLAQARRGETSVVGFLETLLDATPIPSNRDAR